MDRTEDMVRAAAEQEMVPAQEPLDDAGYGFDAAAHRPGEPAMSEHNVTGGPAPVAYLFAGQASALLICPACRAAYVRDEAPLEALASLKDAPPEADTRCALCKVSLSPDRPGPKP